MSALIDVNKLKFTVFGRGYDDERGNSGEGFPEPDSLGIDFRQAVFDETGRYCWAVRFPNYELYKFDTTTWTTVSQGSVPHDQNVFHATNVANNIGVCVSGASFTVFDLTTNEILGTGSVTYLSATTLCDCVLDEDNNIFRIAVADKARVNRQVRNIYLDTMTSDLSPVVYDRAMNGFLDEDSMFMKFPPEWFSQWWIANSVKVNGTFEWNLQATDADTHSFINIGVDCWGLLKDSSIYLPSKIGDQWVMGEYSGLSTPDLITPTPIRTYGNFGFRPTIGANLAYTNGKTKGAFNANSKLYVTDFDSELSCIADTSDVPLAMTETMIVCRGGKVYYI